MSGTSIPAPGGEMATPAVTRLLVRGEALGVPAIASSLVLFGVVLVTGLAVELWSGIDLLTRSSTMALAWLALGPWLIRDAFRLSREFLDSYRPYFPGDEPWQKLLRRHLRRLSRGWLWFGVPWSVITTALVTLIYYPNARGAALVWIIVSFGTLFLLSGIGFWGVGAVVRLVREFAEAGVAFRPYHPDRFGGMAAVGSFSVRAALYFSSGALVLPLAFDLIRLSETTNTQAASVAAYVLTATFILFVICAFALPVSYIKRVADAERVRAASQARSRLEQLIAAYRDKSSHDEQLARQIDMCFEMECGELSKLREYPYDLKVGLELVLAVAVPVAVVVLETVLR